MQILCKLLAVVRRPPEKINQRFAFRRVLLVFANENICVARNRISLIAVSIRDLRSQIVGHRSDRTCRRRRNIFDGRFDKISGFVFDLRHRHIVRFGKSDFDIADGVRNIFDLSGYAVVAFRARTDSRDPTRLFVRADFFLPFGICAGKKFGENGGRSARIRAIDGRNIRVR